MKKAPERNEAGESNNYLDSIIRGNCERLGISYQKPAGYDERVAWEARKPQPPSEPHFFDYLDDFPSEIERPSLNLLDLTTQLLGHTEMARLGFTNEVFSIERYKDSLGALIEELYPNVFSGNIEGVVFQISSTFNDFSEGYRIWSHEDLDKVFQEFLHFLEITLTNKIPEEILINIEQAIEKLYEPPKSSEKIGELKSSVSSLAMQVIFDNTQEQNQEPSIIITHYARPGMHVKMGIGELQKLVRGVKVEGKLDSPFRGNFPEGHAQLLEGDTENIEKNISILQEKMNVLPVSEEHVKYFKGVIERFRYGIYHFHSIIWSTYRSGKKQELNKAIGLANKLLSDTQLELVILLDKFGVTEVIHPYYEGRKISLHGAIGSAERFSLSGGGSFSFPGGFVGDDELTKY